MKRRNFLGFFAGAVALGPVASRSQARAPSIGIIMNVSEGDVVGQRYLAKFMEELNGLGWIDSRRLQSHVRWAAGDSELIRKYAEEIAALEPDVIVAWGAVILRALQAAKIVKPIIFVQITDPVRAGFVASLARPGGQITGFTQFEYDISGKWLQLLKEVAPATRRVVTVWDPTNAAGSGQLAALRPMASSSGVALNTVDVRDRGAFELSMRANSQERTTGLIVLGSSRATAQREQFVMTAARNRVPAVYPYRHFPHVGGLMSYGPDIIDQFRRAAGYADRVLKGEKPADLPVQAPTKFELVINLKTAKALGLTVPLTLLARADEVIE